MYSFYNSNGCQLRDDVLENYNTALVNVVNKRYLSTNESRRHDTIPFDVEVQ